LFLLQINKVLQIKNRFIVVPESRPLKVLAILALSRSFNAFSEYPDQPRPNPKKEGDG